MSSSARAAILARLQAQQAPDAALTVAQRLASPPTTGRIVWPDDVPPQTLLARFLAQAQALKSDVAYVPAAQVPATVAAYLRQHALPLSVVAHADGLGCTNLAAAWEAAGVEVTVRPAQATDAVGLTGCVCAIAETGTVLLTSGVNTPMSPSLLPATHVVWVAEEAIVPAMEDAWLLLRQRYPEGLPRACHFISGPSRTGDIEQTLTLGAHGPVRVLLVVVAPEL